MKMRTGFGYDVHQLAEGRQLWLGGILIPHGKGSIAHSDGDILIHALCDAMLGAAKLRDIGYHFPDTSDEFKGIDSKILLQRTCELVRQKGYTLENADITIAAQHPKLKDYIPDMEQTLARIIGVDSDDISVKATTTERLGFEGREEGISVYAVVLMSKQI
ncbi:MAG: 2-C-methyl-D-erythritol 2,4-cyclodiphosphate synthase [Bacteroidales bacterium]|jgi:2-C-methyl-D-erythritol 2,4-cyclodiphosphate synthase|nr:2-C-methyl-D-erythritol 2,4-cyclodiphosphate synthase [Bacteroidales bacterium]